MATIPALSYRSALSVSSLALAGMIAPAAAADLVLSITHVDSDRGHLRAALYDSASGFESGTVLVAMSRPAREGTVEVLFEGLPAGEYGVMLYHDENDNEKLDTNLIGLPREPWSASLQAGPVMGRPGWEDIRFDLPATGDSVVVDMK